MKPSDIKFHLSGSFEALNHTELIRTLSFKSWRVNTFREEKSHLRDSYRVETGKRWQKKLRNQLYVRRTRVIDIPYVLSKGKKGIT